MKKINQKGLAHLGAVLGVVVFVAIVGLVSWKLLSKDSPASNSTSGATQSTSDSTNSGEANAQKYLEFSDWGVKIPVPKAYPDLYEVNKNLSVHSLDEVDSCAASSTGLARLVRYKVGEKPTSDPGSTVSQADVDAAPVINGYHYLVTAGNGTCTDTANKEWTNARETVLGLTDSIQAL